MRSRRRTHHSPVAWSGSDEEFQSQSPRPAWDAAWDGVRAERKQVGLPNTYGQYQVTLRATRVYGLNATSLFSYGVADLEVVGDGGDLVAVRKILVNDDAVEAGFLRMAISQWPAIAVRRRGFDAPYPLTTGHYPPPFFPTPMARLRCLRA